MSNVKKIEQEKSTSLYSALFAVQQEAPSIGKGTENPFFKSKYASLPDIWDAIKPLLGNHGLFVSHTMEYKDGAEFIISRITHVPDGEFIESVSKIALQKTTAQEYGSYITYMRRYAISAMLGLVTDEDDDGNKATEAAKKQPANPLKETADKIATQLKAADRAEVLEYVWDGFAKELEDIKKASPDKAYPALQKVFEEKKAGFVTEDDCPF